MKKRGLTRLLAAALLLSAVPFAARADAPVLKVTLLGTGTPALRPERQGPATLVEAGSKQLLFDAGRGATVRLAEAGVSLDRVTDLFLTHLHSDHVVGLPDLWLSGWVLGRQEVPLTVRGPSGSRAMLEHLRRAYDYDIRIRQEAGPKLSAAGIAVVVQEIRADGVVYDAGGVTVTAFAVDHGEIKPAFGFRIDYLGRSVVLSGDTRHSAKLVAQAKGADVLIHEVAYASEEQGNDPFWRGVVSTHTSPQEAARVFTAARPTLAVFNHVITRKRDDDCKVLIAAKAAYEGDIRLGHDGMQITVAADGDISVEGAQKERCRPGARS